MFLRILNKNIIVYFIKKQKQNIYIYTPKKVIIIFIDNQHLYFPIYYFCIT